MRQIAKATIIRLLLAALGLPGTIDAFAQASPVNLPDRPLEGTDVRVGAIAFRIPRYVGSDRDRSVLLPALEVYSTGGWFFGMQNGLGRNFSADKSIDYGLRLTPSFGRKESDSPALRGLGDIAAANEFGAFLNADVVKDAVVFTSSIRQGTGAQRKGTLVDLGIGSGYPFSADTLLGVLLGATWANSDYLKRNFGIDPAAAARSGYAAYSPGAGVRDTNLTVQLEGKAGSRWSYQAGATYSRLSDRAGNSPVVGVRGSTSVVFTLVRLL
jgi:outer membrane protein